MSYALNAYKLLNFIWLLADPHGFVRQIKYRNDQFDIMF